MLWVSSQVSRLVFLATLGASLGSANFAFSHPGHAREIVTSDHAMHYVLQPEHGLFPIIAAIVSAVLMVGAYRKRRLQQRLTPVRVPRDR
jgi:hypothetical protein